jgi:hypothetical protein
MIFSHYHTKRRKKFGALRKFAQKRQTNHYNSAAEKRRTRNIEKRVIETRQTGLLDDVKIGFLG